MPTTDPDPAAWLFGAELDLVGAEELPPGARSFLAGLAVLECADLVNALAASPGPGRPWLVIGWLGADGAPSPDLTAELERWRRESDAAGRWVMGSAYGGIEVAAAWRQRDAHAVQVDSPLLDVDSVLATVDVLRAGSRLAARADLTGHPLARELPFRRSEPSVSLIGWREPLGA